MWLALSELRHVRLMSTSTPACSSCSLPAGSVHEFSAAQHCRFKYQLYSVGMDAVAAAK